MSAVAVVGTGYVGLATAVCLADLGHHVTGVDIDDEIPFYVVSNPEFLREGSAIYDFMHPDRLVFGSHHEAAARAVSGLYSKLETKILLTDLHTAEMIKYASNAFLATRISFINEMARICERVDADVKVVSEGMGMDRRIGPLFLDAGIAYGGVSLSPGGQRPARSPSPACRS